jgi:hypothetical protein
LISHLIMELILETKIENYSLSWSPVTESNRRPSPYHACQFRLMASDRVGLPQVGAILVSEYVALRLSSPGAVVTWFVTGFRISIGCGDPAPMSRLSSMQAGESSVLGQGSRCCRRCFIVICRPHVSPSQSVAFGSGCPLTRSCCEWSRSATGMRSLLPWVRPSRVRPSCPGRRPEPVAS